MAILLLIQAQISREERPWGRNQCTISIQRIEPRPQQQDVLPLYAPLDLLPTVKEPQMDSA